MKTATRYLTSALLALAFGAQAGDFRWGGSNRNNKVKYNNTYTLIPDFQG